MLQEDDILFIPYSALANESKNQMICIDGISILVEEKMSDELQANSPIKPKRSPERQIY
jgi:hypothetical protein